MSVFKRLCTIPGDPPLTKDKWCEVQPCLTINLGSRELILTQPTSTFLVYFLGILSIGVGFYFLQMRGEQLSRLWWGISLMLWGIGALLAGTSYQAFSYQIKCAGREICSWTSWWEVIYLILQQISITALLVAISFSSSAGFLQDILISIAIIWAVVYSCLAFAGALIPLKALITFELMVYISCPLVLIMVIINFWRYFKFHNPDDLVLLGAWLLLIIIMISYWLYAYFQVTEKLWNQGNGVWFSQNDLLHLGLIIWMIYLAIVAAPHINDYHLFVS